jgi:hypothetical protein
MPNKRTPTKTDKAVGIVARELAGLADTIRLPKTDRPQRLSRKLYKTAHELTGVPQKRLVNRNEYEEL